MAHRWTLRCPPPPALVAPSRIDRSGRAGPTRGQAYGPGWRRTGRGLFVPATVDRDVVEQRILEEWSRAPAGSVVSGWAALRLHGGNFFDGRSPDGAELPVPVVLPRGSGFRASTIEPHRDRLPASERTTRYGIRCTVPCRALFDAMKWTADLRPRVVVADMALSARLVGRRAMSGYVAGRAGERGCFQVWEALQLAEDRSLSPPEPVMRLIWVLDALLPRPKCNWPIADMHGRRVGRPDLLCEELAVIGEYDGAEHRAAARHAADVSKEEVYRNLGLECFRVVGMDIRDPALVLQRMQAAVRRAREADRPRRWLLRADPGPLF
jgi:hypothetical protein